MCCVFKHLEEPQNIFALVKSPMDSDLINKVFKACLLFNNMWLLQNLDGNFWRIGFRDDIIAELATTASAWTTDGTTYRVNSLCFIIPCERQYLLGNSQHYLSKSAFAQSVLKRIDIIYSSCLNYHVFQSNLPLLIFLERICDKN